MNKDKIRKYISDIQIAMGKILEEMDGFKEVSKTINSNPPSNSLEASIPEEERDAIADILNKTSPKVKEVELSEEELMAQIATECGIENFSGDNITDLQEVALEKFESNK